MLTATPIARSEGELLSTAIRILLNMVHLSRAPALGGVPRSAKKRFRRTQFALAAIARTMVADRVAQPFFPLVQPNAVHRRHFDHLDRRIDPPRVGMKRL